LVLNVMGVLLALIIKCNVCYRFMLTFKKEL
jgi:hypothetical protein